LAWGLYGFTAVVQRKLKKENVFTFLVGKRGPKKPKKG